MFKVVAQNGVVNKVHVIVMKEQVIVLVALVKMDVIKEHGIIIGTDLAKEVL